MLIKFVLHFSCCMLHFAFCIFSTRPHDSSFKKTSDLVHSAVARPVRNIKLYFGISLLMYYMGKCWNSLNLVIFWQIMALSKNDFTLKFEPIDQNRLNFQFSKHKTFPKSSWKDNSLNRRNMMQEMAKKTQHTLYLTLPVGGFITPLCKHHDFLTQVLPSQL